MRLAIFLCITTFFGLVAFGFLLYILDLLSKWKIHVDYLNLSWKSLRYLAVYRKMSKERTGKVGYAYYLLVIFLVCAFISFILGVSPTIII